EDVLYGADDRRMRMWAIAIGVAIIGTHVAMATGAFDATQTAYLDQVWNPAGTIIGGLLFGYGMALSGNCGYGALARLGGGDLRSFMIVLVMGLSAYFVMSGPLAHARVWLFPVETDAEAAQGFGVFAQSVWGISPLITGLVLGGGILALSLSSADMRASPRHIFWGAVVGLAVVSGWLGTYWIAQSGFGNEPIETHTFAAPIGDTIYYSMTASGNTVSFSVGSVLGVIIGAALGSYSKGHFRWEACEDPRELKRQIGGATIMGVGAILAVGCSVGQGISAFSTLAYSAPIAFGAIFMGASLGLRQLISGFAPAE
ncbi:MAG: YeeE/YedE family protein, partial [Pseudomonadota bacterium]